MDLEYVKSKWRESEDRSGPPIGRAFIAFTVLFVSLFGLAIGENTGPTRPELTGRLGAVASTLFVVVGIVVVQRAHAAKSRRLVGVGLLLLFPVALWSFGVSSADVRMPELLGSFVTVASALFSIALTWTGFQHAKWLEAFCGLGLVGLSAFAAIGESAMTSSEPGVFLAIGCIGAASSCLYGALIDLEQERNDRDRQLHSMRERFEIGEQQTRDLLHDLRSGLLSIEAASVLASDDSSGLLRAEIARLRLLTERNSIQSAQFDLVSSIRQLVAFRRAAGVEIDLRSPGDAFVEGKEIQVLAIVQNLIDNAQRHGHGVIRLSIDRDQHGLRVSVADEGSALEPGQVARLFDRGVTTHPDGQGIGLDVAKRLAVSNNADLAYECTETGTTSFVLRFGGAARDSLNV